MATLDTAETRVGFWLGESAEKNMTEDERARELWELGTKRLSEGQVEEAVKLFEPSI